jgi:hypothetical protein
MGKKFDASVANAKNAKIATATRINLCSAEPANYAGIAAVRLLSANLVAASNGGVDGTSGAYTFSTSGNNRRMTVAAQTGMVAAASSGANGAAGTSVNCVYACLDDGTTLLVGDTVPTFSVTAGQTYNTNPFNHDESMIPT